jgi:malate dehydrogenase (oxaloacetate-decarboxylating)(NADP+)
MSVILHKAKAGPKRIVFPEGTEDKILEAAQVCVDEGIAHPVLLGQADLIRARAAELNVDLSGMQVLDPLGADNKDKLDSYARHLWERRRRRGITKESARQLLRQRTPYGLMMVEMGDADGCVDGLVKHYPEVIRPALQIVGKREGIDYVSGVYVVILKDQVKFFADPTVNIHPSAECLAQIAVSTAACKWFDIEPRIAMLSYSNFGSAESDDTRRVAEAVKLVKQRQPGLMIDGEMQVDAALDATLREEFFPFSDLKDDANVLIFPDLAAGNVAYKLMGKLGGAELVGPILLGMRKPVNVLQRGNDVNSIVNMAALTVVRAQGGIGS